MKKKGMNADGKEELTHSDVMYGIVLREAVGIYVLVEIQNDAIEFPYHIYYIRH